MERVIDAIYCDDIRLEIGNKRSLIGVYAGVLFVAAMPAMLPKLCVSVTVRTPADKPFKQLLLKLMLDDTPVVQADFGDDLETQQARLDNIDDIPDESDRFYQLTTDFVLSPFQITEPGFLRVRAETEDGVLKGPALRLMVAEQPATE
jgi:hypothetical protein